MHIELSIEDAIECFGRETIEKWLNVGMQIEHKFQARQAIGFDNIRKLSFEEQHELLKLNVRIGKEPIRKRRKKKIVLSEESKKLYNEWSKKWVRQEAIARAEKTIGKHQKEM